MPGLGQAHARHQRHRRRSRGRASAAAPTRSSRRTPSRRCRSSTPRRLEFEMNVDGLRLERRPRRPGHPAAVAGQDGADDAGLSRQELLGHRRHLRVRPRAQLLPARLRHRAGLHRGHARPRRGPERDQAAARRACTRVPREERATAAGRGSRTSAACAATASSPHSQIRRPDVRTTRAATNRGLRGAEDQHGRAGMLGEHVSRC